MLQQEYRFEYRDSYRGERIHRFLERGRIPMRRMPIRHTRYTGMPAMDTSRRSRSGRLNRVIATPMIRGMVVANAAAPIMDGIPGEFRSRLPTAIAMVACTTGPWCVISASASIRCRSDIQREIKTDNP